MAVLADVGRAYVRLLQMAVIPYITVSLVAGLGRLTPPQAIRIASWGGLVMFSLIMGTALMVSSRKEPLLELLASLDEVLMYITRFRGFFVTTRVSLSVLTWNGWHSLSPPAGRTGGLSHF